MFELLFAVEKVSLDWSEEDLNYVAIHSKKIAELISSDKIKVKDINLGFHKKCKVNIVLVCDNYIRELNKNYRSKDKPTNVLSFQLLDEIDDEYCLGDIFLAYDFIRKDSIDQGKNFYDHLSHLICHGILHLMGYDHVNSIDQSIMESYEINILRRLGIDDPYK